MTDNLKHLSLEIELQPGEKLVLPPVFVETIGAGRWLVTIEPAAQAALIRGHGAFLNGYAAEDEGLYDDYPGR